MEGQGQGQGQEQGQKKMDIQSLIAMLMQQQAEKKIKELEEKYKGNIEKAFEDIKKLFKEDDFEKISSNEYIEQIGSLQEFIFYTINQGKNDKEKKDQIEKYQEKFQQLAKERNEMLKKKYPFSENDKKVFLDKLKNIENKAGDSEIGEDDFKPLSEDIFKYKLHSMDEDIKKMEELFNSINEKQRTFLKKQESLKLQQQKQQESGNKTQSNSDNNNGEGQGNETKNDNKNYRVEDLSGIKVNDIDTEGRAPQTKQKTIKQANNNKKSKKATKKEHSKTNKQYNKKNDVAPQGATNKISMEEIIALREEIARLKTVIEFQEQEGRKLDKELIALVEKKNTKQQKDNILTKQQSNIQNRNMYADYQNFYEKNNINNNNIIHKRPKIDNGFRLV